MKQRGITLIEMLVVIAIIGIVSALGVSLLGNNDERSTREAQTEFVNDLERVRSLVIRYNVGYELSIAPDQKSYSLTPKDLAGVTPTNVPVVSGTLNRATLQPKSTLTLPVILYRAPYARLGIGGAAGCFELVGGSDYRAVVSLVGVTGKVIPRALVKSATTKC
jgi:prepilin-type N-terminal cleavage/methylation domain-containing protein